ncbi:MAG: phage terminase large subunit [Chelatococcus sp.]|uniref:phage terminase large subunit n=1 Tax=Chelatococcus sp. TaxID=1953771 RepID=UPI0025BEDDDE|nr:phage terminase large subunit [Chelatococcus sp.]MBX3537674.1 phage terminase large subunit [Chelatococcus sp.]
MVLALPASCDLFLGGGRGGGKSWSVALQFLRHVETYGGKARGLYIRQTFPGLVDFEQVCREVFGMIYGTAARYNAADHIWRFPNGGTLQLDQFETPAHFSKFQGKSYTLIAVDEAGQYPTSGPIDLLRSCLRAAKPLVTRFLLAANPGGAGHAWIAKRHIHGVEPWKPYREADTGRMFISAPSTFMDNDNLDQAEYERQLRAATVTDPELGKAWIHGDWSIARGAYFASVLDQRRNMVEPWEPSKLPRAGRGRDGWSLYLAHDFGVSAPSVTYVCAKSPGENGPDGRWYPRGSIVLVDELATNEPNSLERGMGYVVPVLAEHVKELAARWNIPALGVADDAIFANTGSGSGSISDEFRAAGVSFTPARKADRRTGWEIMRRMLLAAGEPDVPGLYVSRLCSYWWTTVPSLPRDPKRMDDVDSRTADHGADACRYALLRLNREIGIVETGFH